LRDQSGGDGGQDFVRPAIAVAVVIGLAAATVAGFWCTRPFSENKAVNTGFNQAIGHALAHDFFDPRSTDPRADLTVGVRVDGDFTGTTHEVLRYAAGVQDYERRRVWEQRDFVEL